MHKGQESKYGQIFYFFMSYPFNISLCLMLWSNMNEHYKTIITIVYLEMNLDSPGFKWIPTKIVSSWYIIY